MLRFLAFLWDANDALKTESAGAMLEPLRARSTAYPVLIDKPGAVVLLLEQAEIASALLLDDKRGVVLGTLFDANSRHYELSPRVSSLHGQNTRRIVESNGKSAVRDYWGSYVLILLSEQEGVKHVFNGPMSRLACFHTNSRGIHLCYSSVDEVTRLGLFRPTLNWDCLRAQVTGGDYITRETCLNEVARILPGECLTLDADAAKLTTYWNPTGMLRPEAVGSLKEASALLREKTQLSIASQAALHKKVLLTLSGGLDSSIVLGCLAKMAEPPSVINVNFYNRGNGDERRYARSMTNHTIGELLEIQHDSKLDLRIFLTCARTAAPALNFAACDAEPVLLRLLRETGATAVFSGEIGDDIFGHAFGPDATADCISRYGMNYKFMLASIDYATLRRVSVWRAMQQGWRCWADTRDAPYWSMYRFVKSQGFLQREAKLATDSVLDFYESSMERFIHPWLKDVAGLPVGRLQLISALIASTSTWTQAPFAGELDSSFMIPLAAQPLVEAHARIPAHFHIARGVNGAVLRNSFNDRLSDLVLKRGTGKGTPDLWLKDIIEGNRQFLRETLMDGLLVRERLLDPNKVEAALSGDVAKTRVPTGEIIAQLYVESWIRAWIERPSLRAAA